MKLTLVVLGAGHGSRFVNCGYHLPKPLLPIMGVPLACMALKSMIHEENVSVHNLVFVLQTSHCEQHEGDSAIFRHFPDAQLIKIEQVLPGPVYSGLVVTNSLRIPGPLIFVDCDQFFIHPGICRQIMDLFSTGANVVVSTTDAVGPEFGYVTTSAMSRVIGVGKKSENSSTALAGIYAFSSTASFHRLVEKKLLNTDRDEFRFSDLLLGALERGDYIAEIKIGQHFACGTPEQYQTSMRRYAKNEVHQRLQ